MKMWILSLIDRHARNGGKNLIVCAKSEKQAREIAQQFGGYAWVDAGASSCKLLRNEGRAGLLWKAA